MESEILQDSLENKETKQKVPTELLAIDFELPICYCKDYLTPSHGKKSRGPGRAGAESEWHPGLGWLQPAESDLLGI